MTTVLFVHGTGVRQPAFDTLFALFTARLGQIRPEVTVAPSFWGAEHGARLLASGKSVPAGDSARSIDGLTDEDPEIALWDVLDRDPLFELRLLGEQAGVPGELAPDASCPGEDIAATARKISDNNAPALTASGLSGVFRDAVDDVLSSEPAEAALQLADELGEAFRAALARAIVARAMQLADDQAGDVSAVDGAGRDELVALVLAELGGSDRGIGRFAADTVLRLAMKPVERRRAAITASAAPAAGDVLLYLTRGRRIREFIAAAAAAAPGPVVIVAHSLGGIASLELLATQHLPQVRLLVTVGSQAPLLYELNALPTLEFGAELPATVPPWVNVFDKRDLLAYQASTVFPGRAEDRQVDNRAPFPRSHSAYFANKRFYGVLDEVLP